MIQNAIKDMRGNMTNTNGQIPDWDSMMTIYEKIGTGILEFAQAIQVNWQMVEQAGKADATFVNIVRTAINDSKSFSDRLVQIKNQHVNKKGQLASTEELDQYYAIGESYHNLFEQFQTLSFQVATEITSYLSDTTSSIDQRQNLETMTKDALGQITTTSTGTPS